MCSVIVMSFYLPCMCMYVCIPAYHSYHEHCIGVALVELSTSTGYVHKAFDIRVQHSQLQSFPSTIQCVHTASEDLK